jgi:hypothetical protein
LFGVPVGAFLDPPDGIEFRVPDKRYGLSPAEIAAVVAGGEQEELGRRARAIAARAIAAVMREIGADEELDVDWVLGATEREQ